VTINYEILYFGFYALLAAVILKSEAAYGIRAIAFILCKCSDWIIARQLQKAVRNSLPMFGNYCYIRISCRNGSFSLRDKSLGIQPPFLFADHQLYYS
jgi:hypothetical protein